MKKRQLPAEQAQGSVRDVVEINVQAALALIPYAGAVLSTYFGEHRSRRAAARMQKYFDYFSRRIEELDKTKIDHDYLQTEEFAELFVQGAEEAARSTTERRIRRFANILANNALVDAKARQRTQSIMSFVDRISDLDAFVVLCFGSPHAPSLRARTKSEAYELVRALAAFVGIDCPNRDAVVECIVYMDNLGLTWVNETQVDESGERGRGLILKEFSCFRTPLGDTVAAMIAPPEFFRESVIDRSDRAWPDDHVSDHYRGMASL